MKKALSILLGIAVSGGLLYLALRDVHPREIAALIAQSKVQWLPIVAALSVMDLVVRAVRWRLLLAPLVATSSWTMFQLEAIGLGLNNILLFRAGELVRAFLASKELKLPMLSVLASILVERLCDTVALLLLFSLSASTMPELISPGIRNLALAAGLGLGLGLGALAWADASFNRESPWLRKLERFPRVKEIVAELMIGGRSLRQGHATASIAALSFSLWLCDAGCFWAGARALGFDPALTYAKALSVVASAAGGCALPAMPGSFGNFEAAVKYILGSFGYPKDLAVGYGALVHLIMYLVVTTLGLIFLYRRGHSFASLRKAVSENA